MTTDRFATAGPTGAFLPATPDSARRRSLPGDCASPAVSEYFNGSPVPAFAIDANHVVTQWNKACESITGISASSMVGTKNHWQAFYASERPLLVDLVVSGKVGPDAPTYYPGKCRPSSSIPGAYEVEDYFSRLGHAGRWLHFSAAPLHDERGNIVGAIEVLQDVTERKLVENDLTHVRLKLEELVRERTFQLAEANRRLEEDIRQREATEAELVRRNAELTEVNAKLTAAQEQLIQADKMASIGQLAAGVAHEINNPIGYIFSNFSTLEKYVDSLLGMLEAYEQTEAEIPVAATRKALRARREREDLDFLKEDIPALMAESREGIIRVRKIVQDLKDFSRADTSQDWQWTHLHAGIDSTLNIVSNEVKYRADVVREYGDIPDIECLPSQLNQVIMNMVVNAAHAIGAGPRGTITVRTGADALADMVWIEIADTGCGISKELQHRIFEPFFTTKPIGTGTGLGLALSYGIIQKHRGQISVDSEPGRGTTFRITLPLRQTPAEGESA